MPNVILDTMIVNRNIERYCHRCQTAKPLEDFRRQSSPCRVCEAKAGRNYRKINRERLIIDIVTEKHCSRCKQAKPASAFGINYGSLDGLRSECKSCAAVRDKSRQQRARHADPVGYKLHSMLQGAKKRDPDTDLTLDYLRSLVIEVCPMTREVLKWGRGRRSNASPSLDRIIPELGYRQGNMQIISDLGNRMKNNATVTQMRNFAEYVLNNFPSPNMRELWSQPCYAEHEF
jgi:hypothetical protein